MLPVKIFLLVIILVVSLAVSILIGANVISLRINGLQRLATLANWAN
jgi:hypothetical protein